MLVEADRRSAYSRLGSGYLNPPGLGRGQMVQRCWEVFEEDQRKGYLGSGFWQGFSIESFASLQNVGARNPLTTDAEDLITTIVPSRRARYTLHPEQLIAITLKKQGSRKKESPRWLAEQRLIDRLRHRKDDAPVAAGAPTHLSYSSILWSQAATVRRAQMQAARQFLKEQSSDRKSLFYRFEAIGPLDFEAKR